jgi:hypothetical protein
MFHVARVTGNSPHFLDGWLREAVFFLRQRPFRCIAGV